MEMMVMMSRWNGRGSKDNLHFALATCWNFFFSFFSSLSSLTRFSVWFVCIERADNEIYVRMSSRFLARVEKSLRIIVHEEGRKKKAHTDSLCVSMKMNELMGGRNGCRKFLYTPSSCAKAALHPHSYCCLLSNANKLQEVEYFFFFFASTESRKWAREKKKGRKWNVWGFFFIHSFLVAVGRYKIKLGLNDDLRDWLQSGNWPFFTYFHFPSARLVLPSPSPFFRKHNSKRKKKMSFINYFPIHNILVFNIIIFSYHQNENITPSTSSCSSTAYTHAYTQASKMITPATAANQRILMLSKHGKKGNLCSMSTLRERERERTMEMFNHTYFSSNTRIEKVDNLKKKEFYSSMRIYFFNSSRANDEKERWEFELNKKMKL